MRMPNLEVADRELDSNLPSGVIPDRNSNDSSRCPAIKGVPAASVSNVEPRCTFFWIP